MDPTQIDHHASYHSPLHPLRNTVAVVCPFLIIAATQTDQDAFNTTPKQEESAFLRTLSKPLLHVSPYKIIDNLGL